jgi:hypothetical protein
MKITDTIPDEYVDIGLYQQDKEQQNYLSVGELLRKDVGEILCARLVIAAHSVQDPDDYAGDFRVRIAQFKPEKVRFWLPSNSMYIGLLPFNVEDRASAQPDKYTLSAQGLILSRGVRAASQREIGYFPKDGDDESDGGLNVEVQTRVPTLC